MYTKRAYILILVLLVALKTKANTNDTLTSATIEAISYDLYIQKNWSQLNQFCDRAINAGFDYYYLRMRAGVASYETQKYRHAINHFTKALNFNNNDEVANEYLYYSYVYSGQNEEARRLSKSFDSAFNAKLLITKTNAIEFAYIETGVKVTDNALFKTAFYTSLGLSHYINKRIALMHVGSFYGQHESRFTTNQYQYYLRATIPFKNGFKLSAGFHYAYNQSDYSYKQIDRIIHNIPPQQPLPHPPPTTDTIYSVQNGQVQLNTFIGAVTLTKHFSFADLSIGATVASFDTSTHYQVNTGFMIYPFQNNKFSVGAVGYLHSNNNLKNSFLAVVPSVNITTSKKSYLSLSYFTNKGSNTVEQTGYLLNNSPDLTESRLSVYFSYQIFNKLHLYGIYGYETKKDIARAFHYYYNTAIIGIKIVP